MEGKKKNTGEKFRGIIGSHADIGFKTLLYHQCHVCFYVLVAPKKKSMGIFCCRTHTREKYVALSEMTITRRSSARAGRASSRSAGVRRGRMFFQPTNAFLLRQARSNRMAGEALRMAGEALIPRPEGFVNVPMPPLSPVPMPLYMTFREIFGGLPSPVPFPGFVPAQRRLPFGARARPATPVSVPVTPPMTEEDEDLEMTAWRGRANEWRARTNAWGNAWRARVIPATPPTPATPDVVPATPQFPHSPVSMGLPATPESPAIRVRGHVEDVPAALLQSIASSGAPGLPATPESPLYSPIPPQLEPATPPRGKGKKELDDDDDDEGMSDDEVDRYQQAVYESTIAAASPPRCPCKSTDGCKEMPIKIE
jgi:hypothetical protein